MMAEQPAKKYCANPECHKELRDWRKKYCSPECYPQEPEKPSKRKPPNPRPVDEPSDVDHPPIGELDKPKSKEERISAVFADMARYNLTQAQACAGHDLRPETF